MAREWTQRLMMMPPNTSSITPPAASSSSVNPKSTQLQQLKCPRCDSSNTKFCYYNNYSLSQPRHFCKACKRYWTRGGTLRNVPVGGGCRKNKRASKKATPATASSAAAAATTTNPPSSSTSTVHPLPDLTSFLYGLPSGTSTAANTCAYDQLGLGGLSPGLINPNPADPNYHFPSSFGSQAASLLVSSLQAQKQPTKMEDQYQSLWPYEACASANLGFLKAEDSNINSNIFSNSTEWMANYQYDNNLINAAVPAMNGAATDSSYFYWNPAIGDVAQI